MFLHLQDTLRGDVYIEQHIYYCVSRKNKLKSKKKKQIIGHKQAINLQTNNSEITTKQIKSLDLFKLCNIIDNSIQTMKTIDINLYAINKYDLISKAKILYNLITFNRLINDKLSSNYKVVFYMSKKWINSTNYSCIWTLDFINNNDVFVH